MDLKNLTEENKRLRRAALIGLCFCATIWTVWLAEYLFQTSFAHLGINPRELSGLTGILLTPLLHGSFGHLVSNTLPAFVLISALIYVYPKSASATLLTIYLGSGLAVWLFARSNIHIGASGVVHGCMFFLFVIGLLRRDRLAIGLSLAVLFLYGSMIWGIVPGDPKVSWEAHLAGAFLGVVCAVVFRSRDPNAHEKTYDWEAEEDDAEIYIIDSPDS